MSDANKMNKFVLAVMLIFVGGASASAGNAPPTKKWCEDGRRDYRECQRWWSTPGWWGEWGDRADWSRQEGDGHVDWTKKNP